MKSGSPFVFVTLLSFLASEKGCAYLSTTTTTRLVFSSLFHSDTVSSGTTTCLAAKASKKKKAKAGTSAAGIKGFGSARITTSGGGGGGKNKKKKDIQVVKTDRSKQARAFYEYLDENGAGSTLKRTALAYFPLPSSDGDGSSLRGVVALKDIKKGDEIINIPYELAVNLGAQGEDPTVPALALLRDYCEAMMGRRSDSSSSSPLHRKAYYYDMLPPFRGEDCLGSTDFFSDVALEQLQSPLIVEETLRRRERTRRRFEQDVDDNFPPWIDGSPVTEEHLRWAVWLITSRVLTVQGAPEEGRSYRLLIPFLDMCNHDRSSPHTLTGRAVKGGELRVVAGANVLAGDQINICYGGGVAGNDRFIQDYAFVDPSEDGFDIVAQQLLGKRRAREGANAGKTLSLADRERCLEAVRMTTVEEDEAMLKQELDFAVRAAIDYRLGLKKALSKWT